jgi:glycosyltransferase involved in cell wall biosynthesis
MHHEGVTVAITNWNHELFLPRSIGSALAAVAQLRKNSFVAEVLVVDDASRDGSLTLLRQLEAECFTAGLRVLGRVHNGGPAQARNHALRNARSRFVLFLDADNELVPENVPTLCRSLLETEAAAVFGNLLVKTAASREAFHVLSNESFQERMFQDNYIDTLAMYDREQLLDVGGFSDRVETQEDFELWLHLASNGRKIVFVPVVAGYYCALPRSFNLGQWQKTYPIIHRIYDQVGARHHLRSATRHLRYHPAIGYV